MKSLFRPSHLSFLTLLPILACVGILLFVGTLSPEEFNWPEPISSDDWIDAESSGLRRVILPGVTSEKVRAGNNLFGYPAPLENFIKIYEIGDSGGDTVESWIDEGATASYILPLYDDEDFVAAFFVLRTSYNMFFAPQNNYLYFDYLQAKKYLGEHQSLLEDGVECRIFCFGAGRGLILYADWGDVSAGKVFSYWPSCGSPEDGEPEPFNLNPYVNRVLSEEEILQLFRGLSEE